jgi:ornithine carbamoyltransferase
MKKYFLSMDDITKSEIFEIFEITKQLKKNPYGNQLNHKIFALFFKHSLPWLKLSFEAGIKQLNGSVIHFNPSVYDQLLKEKSLDDMIKNLKKHVDATIMGAFSHRTLQNISKYSDVSIINAVSDLENPCQVLSDLFTIKERFKDFETLKLVYVGDGNNVCNSLLLGCAKVGMDVAVACPNGYEPDKNIVELARNYTRVSKSRVTIGTEPKEIVKDANIIYNDTFISMGDEKEKQKRLSIFIPKYQVNDRLLKSAASDVLYMHPLPAQRGEEVTPEVIDSLRSIVFDQAENRMHAQKALLMKMMGIGTL